MVTYFKVLQRYRLNKKPPNKIICYTTELSVARHYFPKKAGLRREGIIHKKDF